VTAQIALGDGDPVAEAAKRRVLTGKFGRLRLYFHGVHAKLRVVACQQDCQNTAPQPKSKAAFACLPPAKEASRTESVPS
jgi:hypothetical protein